MDLKSLLPGGQNGTLASSLSAEWTASPQPAKLKYPLLAALAYSPLVLLLPIQIDLKPVGVARLFDVRSISFILILFDFVLDLERHGLLAEAAELARRGAENMALVVAHFPQCRVGYPTRNQTRTGGNCPTHRHTPQD